MRFARVIPATSELPRQAAPELIRKLAVAVPRPAPQPEPAAACAELPLDQRVRLVGEW